MQHVKRGDVTCEISRQEDGGVLRVGFRKPSIKRSIKARTTGRIKRSAKRAVDPLYGQKGVGLLKDPKRSITNGVYRRTTVGVSDLLKRGGGSGCLVPLLSIGALGIASIAAAVRA